MQNRSPLTTLIHSQAEKYGDRTALRFKGSGERRWRNISWREFSQKVKLVSSALLQLHVGVQEKVGVFSQNMPECLYVNFGAYAIRAVSIPFYATSSESQVKYIVTDASIAFIFVGEQAEYDVAFRVLQFTPCLKRLIIFSKDVVRNAQDHTSIYFDEFLHIGLAVDNIAIVEQLSASLQPDDLADILYTSGTTGLSKGVMITHLMYEAAIKAHDGPMPIREDDVALDFLPFTHVFERGWAYLCLTYGATLAINLRPEEVLQSMREVRPTCMCAVPRFWEKVYGAVQETVRTSGPVQKKILLEALAVGKEYNVDYLAQRREPPMKLKLKYKFYEGAAFSPLLRRLGLERHHLFPTAGAAIPPVVEEFVRTIGLGMITGYGMTETTASVSFDRLDQKITIGSVGRVLGGLEIKIGDNSEILLKGDAVTKGYFRKAEVTALAIDDEGWFHTGDAGYFRDGELFLTERLKDMFKTSNGKYIAPQMLESKLCVDRYIDQIVVIADQKKFVSALVIPNYQQVEQFAQDNKIAYADCGDLCRNPQVVELVMYRIETLQQEFANYEKVKKITLLPEPFSLAKGELTNTLKVKRAVINERYRVLIDKMYESR
ncbi:MAG: long-chain fatty acid--CoA ligase [Prevotellaceae bacterium]|nr:long-chain fatty acid--CoA ligase [Prevotellaceae bacterium]